MADQEIRRGQAETPRLDTLSYYDDTEPNWNERPYFTKVEATRGRSGWHIDVSVPEPLKVETDGNSLIASPASEFGSDAISKGLTACLKSQGNCVVLSGFGGDEVAGGVPTPIPELEDLLSQGDLQKLARQLKAWALNKRKPWLHLLSEAARRFLPSSTAGIQGHLSSAPWLNRRFMQRNRLALLGSGCRVKVFGPPPSFQENLGSLEVLGRQLSCSAVSSDPLYEKRYPYLDRDLLEFFYAVPREQLVRPGQRRSLVRRALIGIVPDEILNRRRKAYVARAPIATLSASLSSLLEMSQNMISHSFGFIDACAFREALQELTRNRDIPIVCLLRTIGVEFWLRNLVSSKLTPIATSENRSPAGCTYKNVLGHEQEKARRLRSSPVPNRNHRDKRNSTCKS
jgi:asparagine synthase (glutamine-hydrolysing)